MKLEITFKNQLRVLSFHLIGTMTIIVALFFLNFDRAMIISFGSIWILLTIPVAYLHAEYFLKNRDERIEIQDNEIVIIAQGKTVRNYHFEDLKKVILYKSASLNKGGLPMLPTEFYHFARIVPKQGEDIIITCLMTPDVEKVVNEIKWVKYERKKLLFSSINFESLV